jgi:hypothetical protein
MTRVVGVVVQALQPGVQPPGLAETVAKLLRLIQGFKVKTLWTTP